MMSTSPSENEQVQNSPPGLVTKESHHPLAQILLGEVIAAQWLGDQLILFYADNHKAAIDVDSEGDIVVRDHQVKSC